ncbi:MAG: TldD/PmbA family protein [Acidobacteriota bacterium]
MKSGMKRRDFLGYGATAAIAIPTSSSLIELLFGGEALAAATPGTSVRYFARFGVTEALLRETLGVALAKGADHADVFLQHRISNQLSLEDGAVNRAYARVELGAGVRVVKGDQQGYGYTEDLSAEALKEAARTAAVIADGPAREAPAKLRVTEGLPSRYAIDTPWESVRPQPKLALLDKVNAQMFASDPRIAKVTIGFSDQAGVILIADATGRIVEDVQPMTSLYVSCVAEKDGRREQNGYNVAARAGMEFYAKERVDRVVKEAVARTVVLFDAEPAPAGEMPVVMAAGSSGILLHEAIGHGMEADFNRKGISIYADKIGKPVAQKFVNIVDEGTLANARGALNVDDEGNGVGTTHLVTDGILTTYLHDSISAKHYKVESTGNGRRESYAHIPMPRMRATYMLPGPHKADEIVASVKKGLLCEAFSNGQVNIGPGDFTFYVKNGWLIENGKKTKPVKDVNIIGNGPKVLERIDMVADDLKIDEGGWTCGKEGQSVPVLCKDSRRYASLPSPWAAAPTSRSPRPGA